MIPHPTILRSGRDALPNLRYRSELRIIFVNSTGRPTFAYAPKYCSALCGESLFSHSTCMTTDFFAVLSENHYRDTASILGGSPFCRFHRYQVWQIYLLPQSPSIFESFGEVFARFAPRSVDIDHYRSFRGENRIIISFCNLHNSRTCSVISRTSQARLRKITELRLKSIFS